MTDDLAGELDDVIADETLEEFQEMEGMPSDSGDEDEDFIDRLMAETGDGPIDQYQSHALNPEGRDDRAQAIRGWTGLFRKGLNKAVIDILFGHAREAWNRALKPVVKGGDGGDRANN